MAAPTEAAANDRAPSSPSLLVSLQQADARHRRLLSRAFVRRCLGAALAESAEITVRVVAEAEGRRLDREWRGQDHATNVLTFVYARQPAVVADIVLCAPVVEREAAALGIGIEAHYAHLLVHGALHAQGFDHEKARDAKRMEARERAVLASLGVADPCGNSPQRASRTDDGPGP